VGIRSKSNITVKSSVHIIVPISRFNYPSNDQGRLKMAYNVLRIGDGGHLKNVSPTFAQMPNRTTNVEFTTVSPHYCQYDVACS
jgi:hypothetical protein